MVDTPRFVVDASVAVKWHLDDEEFSERALALLREYREGRVYLLAPDHIRYEVANAIGIATKTKRIAAKQGRIAIEMFLAWAIPTATSNELILAAYDISQRLDCSFYDGLYLAVAQATNCPVIHADQALHRKLKDKFPLAVWIGDYVPPSSR